MMILRTETLLTLGLTSLSALAADTRSSDASRPRGVSPEFAKFYKQTDPGYFTCISNPSQVIPFHQVNDDFCDCPDGSDEPGTSACSYLSHLSPPQPKPNANALTPANESLALPGFYCKNKGHIPNYLRFEAVNDGICDYDICCDGSDEYAHVGGVKCEDRCGAIGKEHKKQEEIRQKSYNKALKKRKELQFEADRARKEVEEKLEALKIKIEGLERKVTEAEDNFVETEKREKLKAVRADAAGKGTGRLGVLSTLAKDRINELRATLTRTRFQRDSMVDRVTELENILNNLKSQYNPNFNDAGVKAAVQGWEDYAARETDDSWTDAEDRDLEAIAAEDGPTNGINFADFENDSEPDTPLTDAQAIYSLTSYLPPFLQTALGDFTLTLRNILINNGILPSSQTTTTSSDPSADTPALASARKARDDAQRDLSTSRTEFTSTQSDLDQDFGPSGIFRALKHKCVSTESGEYTYTHCFLQKLSQKPKRGGAETNMGNFVGYDIEYVDEETPKDGKGLGRGDRIVLKYEGGQSCWNGPQRSTRVVLACWEEEEIWRVREAEKCVYRVEVGTAAVCGWERPTDGPEVQDAPGVKDEL